MTGSSTAPSVTMVIPTWNGWHYLEECLGTIAAQRYDGTLTTLVVDNGSADGTADKLRREWPDVRLIRFEENRGFAGACNAGMQAALDAGADYVMLVNNDTLLHPDMTRELVRAAQAEPRAGLLNPIIGYADRPDVVWAHGNVMSLYTGEGDGADVGRPLAEVASEGVKRVEAATGCIVMAPARVARELGLLAEDLFMYYEDMDWSLRVRKAGYEILAVPTAVAWHKISSAARRTADYSAFLYYYNIRNRLAVMQRHARWHHWAVFAPRFGAWLAFKVAGLTVLGRHGKRNGIVDGLRDFLAGRYPQVKYEARD